MFCNKGVLKNLGPVTLLIREEETATQMFSCEYCEMFQNTSFEEHLQAVASKIAIANLKKAGKLHVPFPLTGRVALY